jgi:large subunit ribosomal protein L13
MTTANQTVRAKYEIDAKDQSLGRLATQVAAFLMGKNSASYERHKDMGGTVVITNASKIKVTGKKMEQKEYYHHSGYPGGLKTKTMEDIFKKDPAEVIKRAVWNMLPKNKLRDEMIKRLKITN